MQNTALQVGLIALLYGAIEVGQTFIEARRFRR